MDWREFVETMSLVEQVLREDPASVYAAMDFATRDRYRHAVERPGQAQSAESKREVARRAIVGREALAGTRRRATALRTSGFYLIDEGLSGWSGRPWRVSFCRRIRAAWRAPAAGLYLGTILIVAGYRGGGAGAQLQTAPAMQRGRRCGRSCIRHARQPAWLCRWRTGSATRLRRPQRCRAWISRDGFRPRPRTLVVVPTSSPTSLDVDQLLDGLEVRYLAQPGRASALRLLTDFRDAPQETLPEDEPLLDAARGGHRAAEREYRGAGDDRFFLFHRPRRWNAQEADLDGL